MDHYYSRDMREIKNSVTNLFNLCLHALPDWQSISFGVFIYPDCLPRVYIGYLYFLSSIFLSSKILFASIFHFDVILYALISFSILQLGTKCCPIWCILNLVSLHLIVDNVAKMKRVRVGSLLGIVT